MSIRWQDYTMRVRVGEENRAHLACAGSPYVACGLGDGHWRIGPDDAPLCKACARAIEAAKK